MSDEDKDVRRSRRLSLDINQVLSDLELPEKDGKKIRACLEHELTILTSAHAATKQQVTTLQAEKTQIQAAMDVTNQSVKQLEDEKTALKTELDEKCDKIIDLEKENDDLLSQVQNEIDTKDKLLDNIKTLEKENAELIDQCSGNTSLTDGPNNKPKVVVFADQILTGLAEVDLPATAIWNIDESIGNIADLEKTLNDDTSRMKIKEFDKVILILGPQEILAKQQADTLSRKYREIINDLTTLTSVSVIEPPCVRPTGYYSGMRVFISDVRKKLPDDVEIVSMKLDASIGMKHFLNLFTPKKIAVRSLIQGYAWYELYLVFEDSKSYSVLDFLQARSLFVCLPKALCTGCSKNLCAI